MWIGLLPGQKNPGTDLLSHGVTHRSIIGAGELNCRVRDGNGCYLSAMGTRTVHYTRSFTDVKSTASGKPAIMPAILRRKK